MTYAILVFFATFGVIGRVKWFIQNIMPKISPTWGYIRSAVRMLEIYETFKCNQGMTFEEIQKGVIDIAPAIDRKISKKLRIKLYKHYGIDID